MKYTFLTALLCGALISSAQLDGDSWVIENYHWADQLEPETREWIKTQDEAITKSTTLLEYRYEEDDMVFYELNHRIIWIGNEKTIEGYNRLYVPIIEDGDIRIQARVLQPNGAVINLDENDIQEGKDEDDNTYRYFALDGIEVGSLVEYLFLTKGYPSFYGSRYTLQRDAPIYDLNFELVTPGNLLFKIKSYNGLNDAEFDTVLTEQNRFFLHQDTLAKFEEEPQAYERAHMAYVVFALDRNYYNGLRDMSSFGNAASRIFSNLKVDVNKKVEKGFKRIIAESGMNDEKDLDRQIAALEGYLKDEFFVQNSVSTEAMVDVEQIMKNKVMNEIGCLRLYSSLFTYAGIENELVLTSDRSSTPFDPEFENNLFLREDLMYFPEAEVFISPTNQLSRMGCFDADLRHTQGLFVSGIDLGEGPQGIGEVKYIPPQTIDENKSELTVNWTLGADGDVGEIKVERKTYGQQSGNNQTIAPYVPEDKMDEFKKGVLKWMYPEVEFEDYEVENLEPKGFPYVPLIVRTHFTDEVYTEPGSTSTVVKVGDIIGPQAEMYMTDSVRNLPVNHGFPRWYHREITINVPAGFTLKNTESLEMLVSSEGDDPEMIFKSTYTYENNVLRIVIDEWYKGGEYPASQFETYRSVINAAADFNKKYLVLEKS